MNGLTLVGVVVTLTPIVLIVSTLLVRGKKLFD
jgi:hypothetical protein